MDTQQFDSMPANDFSDSLPLLIASRKLANLNGFLLSQGLQQHGYVPVWQRPGRLLVYGPREPFAIRVSDICTQDPEADRFLADKAYMREQLQHHAVGVANGAAFHINDKARALQFFQQQRVPCVVKPAIGNKGQGASVGIETDDEFSVAWDHACAVRKRGDQILVEHQFRDATEARLLVVDGVCVGAFTRIPPGVTGDGRQSVIELIEEKNLRKSFNPNECRLLITLDAHRERILARQGLTADSVVAAGRHVRIDYKGSVSAGADTLEVLPQIHSDYKRIAERVAACAAPVAVVGVDIMAKDFTQPSTPGSYIVLEGNKGPALGGHLYPSYGEPSDVVTPIVEHCLRTYPLASCSSVRLSCELRIIALNDNDYPRATEALTSALQKLQRGGAVYHVDGRRHHIQAALTPQEWQALLRNFHNQCPSAQFTALLHAL